MKKPSKPTGEILKAMKRMGDVVYDGALRKARGAAARVARDAAKRTDLVTRRTGRLFDGVRVSNTKQGTKLVSDAPHSLLVEQGHGGPQPAPPKPFLESAIRATQPAMLQAGAKVIAREFRKLHKG